MPRQTLKSKVVSSVASGLSAQSSSLSSKGESSLIFLKASSSGRTFVLKVGVNT